MIKNDYFRPYAAAYAMLIRNTEIFLMRRYKTGWQDGKYNLPAGHMSEREKVAGTAAREAKEECGVDIREEDLRFVHAMHRVTPDREYVDYFFVAEKWEGEPHIAEPEKCDDVRWFSLDALPGNLVESVRAGIQNYRKGVFFSEFGWDGRV